METIAKYEVEGKPGDRVVVKTYVPGHLSLEYFTGNKAFFDNSTQRGITNFLKNVMTASGNQADFDKLKLKSGENILGVENTQEATQEKKRSAKR